MHSNSIQSFLQNMPTDKNTVNTMPNMHYWFDRYVTGSLQIHFTDAFFDSMVENGN